MFSSAVLQLKRASRLVFILAVWGLPCAAMAAEGVGGVWDLTVLCAGEDSDLCRPCVDCGRITGRFCYGDEFGWTGLSCLASDRVPRERWQPGQRTPLCSVCDDRFGSCRMCRGVHGCTPFTHRIPCSESR